MNSLALTMNTDSLIKRQLSLMPDMAPELSASPDGRQFESRPVLGKLVTNAQRFLRGKQDAERLTILPGLRGVGKTTLLLQLYQALAGEGVPAERRLYLPCDRLATIPGASLSDAVHSYEIVLGSDLASQKAPTFILLDEAQYAPDWGLAAKVIFDEARAVQLVVTGSSALALKLNPDVARRAAVARIAPMGLSEYLFLNGLLARPAPSPAGLAAAAGSNDVLGFFKAHARSAGRALATVPGLEHAVRRFLLAGSLPSTMGVRDLHQAWSKTYRAIERIMEMDLPAIGHFDQNTLRAARPATTLIADSAERSIQKLASELALPPATTMGLVEALVKSELLLEVPAAGPPGKGARRKKRHYYSAPSMMAAVLDAAGLDPWTRRGELLECAAAGLLARLPGIGLRYDPDGGGADFVLEGKSRGVVEVGWGDKGDRQVMATMSRHKAAWGFVVCECGAPFLSGKVVHVPVEQFLAMG